MMIGGGEELGVDEGAQSRLRLYLRECERGEERLEPNGWNKNKVGRETELGRAFKNRGGSPLRTKLHGKPY